MDPNATLAEIRQLTKEILDGNGSEYDAARLAELVEGLDNWLSRQGFLPTAWER